MASIQQSRPMDANGSSGVQGQNAPTPAQKQAQFALSVTLLLFLWPSLSLAVTSNWGGPDSLQKREWFAQTTIDLLSEEENADVDAEWIEEFLLQVMLDEFEVVVEDGSAFEVAEGIVKLRGECGRGVFGSVEEMRRRWEARGGGSQDLGRMFEEKEGEDEDEESEEDGGDMDVDMDEAPPLVRVREPVVPEVDEDGFTKVTKKKR